MSRYPIRIQFSLKRIFVAVGIVTIVFAGIYYYRVIFPPEHVSGARFIRLTNGVYVGMSVDQISRRFGFPPTESEIDRQGNGQAYWCFRIEDPLPKAPAYFADFTNGKMVTGSSAGLW